MGHFPYLYIYLTGRMLMQSGHHFSALRLIHYAIGCCMLNLGATEQHFEDIKENYCMVFYAAGCLFFFSFWNFLVRATAGQIATAN